MTTTGTQSWTKFVVWAPDNTEPGIHEKRLALRPQHLENVHQLIREGIIRVGGGVLTSESANAASPDRKFFGSVLIIEAEGLEVVRKLVEGDLYYTEGVWDKAKLQILPVALAHSLAPASLE